MTADRTTLAQGFDSLLLAIPELQSLQVDYAAATGGMTMEERLAWLDAQADPELLAELVAPEYAEQLGLSPGRVACALLDDMLRTWTDTGSPQVIGDLLAPSVLPQKMPDGSTVLIAVIHQFSELDLLFAEIRNAYTRTFPPVGIRADTLDDLSFVLTQLSRGMRQTDIAWELVYRSHPHVRTFDKGVRIADYGDLHRKAYGRVRWLKSKALKSVSELDPELSQNQP